ncbi:capsular polysaccharide synthesis enzyme Cap8D [Planococcus halocryophilus Or1]|uniref:Capsule biosynthesis protein CapD n=1 Tax=Planococcus halocryophilus TaxID=1215089 RepID=A0A1C7DR76_9BACL|nr:SDR family NAD(P)-dependent oxidoreductase [Planococcus halocryophilus]ANU13848.1 capsule biosynthesis protein CapD [Planococcus halocryophilus]EMF47575.1 capsular polysaccharide synthesis enzyme Cap8D [Planococcus halocryophilus Or1]
MKIDKRHIRKSLHRSQKTFLLAYQQFRTFVLEGFEHFEQKFEHKSLSKMEHLTGKVVMITGADGMIGSEISRQLMGFSPERILLVGHGPQSIYTVEYELRKQLGYHSEIIPIIINIQDKKRLFEVVERHMPDVIYHTAGNHQIDFTEEQFVEAVYVNALGTNNIAEAANRYHVGVFVQVSSEQAGNPIDLLEAAKRLSEVIVESISQTSLTKYIIIRLPGFFFTDQLASKYYPVFEQQVEVVSAVQKILQIGGATTAFDKGDLTQHKNKFVYTEIQKQKELSQIEMASLLKQLKTASEDEVKELVISAITQ